MGKRIGLSLVGLLLVAGLIAMALAMLGELLRRRAWDEVGQGDGFP